MISIARLLRRINDRPLAVMLAVESIMRGMLSA